MDTPRRRWFQFSLRTLLVLMVILSLGMGWLMQERRRIAVRREALISAGWVFDDASQPAWHRMIFGDDEPGFTLLMSGHPVTDADLIHLTSLSQLQDLRIGENQITDALLVLLR